MQALLNRMNRRITVDETEERKGTQKKGSIRGNVHQDRLLNKQAGLCHQYSLFDVHIADGHFVFK